MKRHIGWFGLFAVGVVFLVGCPLMMSGTNPEISVFATPTVGTAPVTITFEATLVFAGKYRDPGTIPSFPPIGGTAPASPCVLISYTWNYGDGQTEITFTNTAIHTYTTPGVYTVTVTANFINCPSVSATTTVTILAGNTPPVANAGPDRTVPFVDEVNVVPVTLDGSASYDPAKSITQYIWTGDPDPDDVVQPTVYLTLGTYVFTLRVIDNDGLESEPDTVTITVALPPVADAGKDINVPLPPGSDTASVQLDGSGSYDPNDTTAKSLTQYIWTGDPDPEDVMQPSLNLPLGEYEFTLVVQSSNGLTSDSDTVRVRVLPPPVADAGDDQVVAYVADVAAIPVVLDGTRSYDPKDSEDKSIMQYHWTGTPDPEDVAQPTVMLTPGIYTFTLVVVDNYGLESAPDTVTVIVVRPPVANAGPDQIVFIPWDQDFVNVTLDGSGSYDPSGSIEKSLVQYIWTGDPDPEDIVQPTVSLGPGTYVFTLQVRNSAGLLSLSDTVIVTVLYEEFEV